MTTSEPPPLLESRVQKRPAVTLRRRKSSPAAVILLYLIVVFIGAALIAPRLYASAQFLESISYRFSFLADAPFHRFVSRCLLLLAILGLPTLFRALNLKPSLLGLKLSLRNLVAWILGFGWAFVALAILGALLITFEARLLDLEHPGAAWTRHLKNAALAALMVSILEELLFRGALFGSLRQTQSFFAAAFCSSSLYALLHFLEKPEFTGRVEWTSGFTVLGGMLAGFANWDAMIPAFLNLTLLGFIFALVFERSSSLFFPIGLHAGIVFFVKSLAFVTDERTPGGTRLWGSDKFTDGWMTTFILLLIFLIIERTVPPRKAVDP